MSIVITSDGSCLYPNGPGGYAALIRFGVHEKMVSGGAQGTTNNRMELMAAIEGLKALTKPCVVKMVVDSQYVMNPFTKGWMEDWKKSGMKSSSGNPVKNQDLMMELDSLVRFHTVTWEWVKGHSGHPDNERVDEEAGKQSAHQKTIAPERVKP